MSASNVEIVREIYARHARHDNAGVYELYDPEIEWDATGHAAVAGMGFGVFRGHEGVRRFWTEWLGAWEISELKLDQVIDAGEKVVAFSSQRTRGRTSGLIADMLYADVWTLRGGKVIRYQLFDDRDRALAQAGVSQIADRAQR